MTSWRFGGFGLRVNSLKANDFRVKELKALRSVLGAPHSALVFNLQSSISHYERGLRRQCSDESGEDRDDDFNHALQGSFRCVFHGSDLV